MKHTQGKWKQSGSCVYIPNNFRVQISWPMSKDELNEEAVANAKLIAAAPELLEALKYQVYILNENKEAMEPHMQRWIQGMINKMEQAIKKATE